MSPAPWLIVPAAGRGTRMRADCPKQYLDLEGRPVLTRTLARLHEAFPQGRLLLCLDPHDRWFDAAMVPFTDWWRIDGGAERADSVAAAVAWLVERAGDDEPVLVHDLARPCVTPGDLRRLYAAVEESEAGALLATPVTDTLKRDDGAGRVEATVSRTALWRALTPQGFRLAVLRAAFDHAREHDFAMTDEASGVERLGPSPRLVEGRSDNLKITHPEDLALAALILRAQQAEASASRGVSSTRSSVENGQCRT